MGEFVTPAHLTSAIQGFTGSVAMLYPREVSSASVSDKLVYLALHAGSDASKVPPGLDVRAVKAQAVSFLVAIAADKQNHEAIKVRDTKEGGKLLYSFLEQLSSSDDQLVLATASTFTALAESDSMKECLANDGVLQKILAQFSSFKAAAAELLLRAVVLCAQNEKGQKALCGSNSIPQLLEIAQKNLPSAGNPKVLMYAVWGLAVLSPNKEAAAQIASAKVGENEGASILLLASETSPDYALSSLLQLTTLPEGRKSIASSSVGIGALFNQLKPSQNSKPANILRTTKILANLCLEEENRKIVASHSESHSIVLSLLAEGAPNIDAQLKSQLMKLLCYMASGELSKQEQFALIQSGALEKLLTVVKSKSEPAEILLQAVSSIANLLAADEIRNTILEMKDGAEQVIELLKSNNPAICKEAARGIANCCTGHFDDAREAFSGAIPALKDLLSRGDDDTKKEALRALTNIARSYECAIKVSTSDVIPTLLQLFNHATSTLQFTSTMLLVNLSANDKARIRLTQIIKGQPSMFVELLRNKDPAMQLQGLKILSNLSVQGRNRLWLQKTPSALATIKQLETNGANDLIKRQAEVASMMASIPCESEYGEEDFSADSIALPDVQEEEEEEEEIEEEETEAEANLQQKEAERIALQREIEQQELKRREEEKKIQEELEKKKKQEEEQKKRVEEAKLRAQLQAQKEEEARKIEEEEIKKEAERRRREQEQEEENRKKEEEAKQILAKEQALLEEAKQKIAKTSIQLEEYKTRLVKELAKLELAQKEVEEAKKLVLHRQERVQRKLERDQKRAEKHRRKSIAETVEEKPEQTLAQREERLKKAHEKLQTCEATLKRRQSRVDHIQTKISELSGEAKAETHTEASAKEREEWEAAQKRFQEILEKQKQEAEQREKERLARAEEEKNRQLAKEQKQQAELAAQKEREEALRLLKEEEERLRKSEQERLQAEKLHKEAEEKRRLAEEEELKRKEALAKATTSSVVKKTPPAEVTNPEEVKAKIHQKRSSIAKEIFTVEKNYVDSLNVIIWKFLRPLEAVLHEKSNKTPLLSQQQIKHVFLNIEIIFNFSSLLLEGISNRMKTWNETTKLGDVFAHLTGFISACYTEFINGYDQSVEILQAAKKANEELDNFIKRQEKAKECRFLPLEAFLVMPVQQVPRYVMLLADLFKNTPNDHPDYADLEKALSKMKEAAATINEKKRTADNLAKVYGVEILMTGKCPTLVSPSRRWTKEGALGLVDKSGNVKPVFVHLFNDLLLVSTVLQLKGKYKYHSSAVIDNRSTVEQMKEIKKAQFVFKVTFGEKKSILQFNCTTAEERTSWISAIQALIKH